MTTTDTTLVALAHDLAAKATYGDDFWAAPVEDCPTYFDRLQEASREVDVLGFELAFAAGFDVDTLERVRAAVPKGTVWCIATDAHLTAVRKGQDSVNRARHLARLVAAGIPAADECFRREHVDLALEIIDDVYAEDDENPPEHRPALVDVRLWLIDFADRACSPV